MRVPTHTDRFAADMKAYVTRSIASKIERIAKLQPDSEFIRGEISATGMGIHLRWEYPDMHAGDYQSCILPSAPVPHPASASALYLSSTRTSMSSDKAEAIGSLPRVPTQVDLYETKPRSQHHPSYARAGGARTNDTAVAQSSGSAILGQQQREYAIYLEQMQRLQAWKKVKDEQWAQAEAAGLFDADENDSDDKDGDSRNGDFDQRGHNEEQGNPAMPGSSQGSLTRSDTWRCESLEPPSRMGPTLSQPRLPYMRDPDSQSPADIDSTLVSSTTTTTISPTPWTSVASGSVPARCVRRYQEDGVWVTKGSFNDIPALAHLAAYHSLKSFDDPQLHQTLSLNEDSRTLVASTGQITYQEGDPSKLDHRTG